MYEKGNIAKYEYYRNTQLLVTQLQSKSRSNETFMESSFAPFKILPSA